MGETYLPLLIYVLVALAVPILLSLAATHLGPKKHEPQKYLPYESGFPTPPLHGRFPVSFYHVAMLFVVFDVEAAAFYPWAVLLQEFKGAGLGAYALMAMAVYIVVLGIGYAYEWKKGGLSWK